MKQFGLIGFPLGHSFSVPYFAEKFRMEGLVDTRYENYPLKSIDLFPDFIRDHSALEGINVTIPYKESVIQYLTHIDPAARQIGAVNCIKIKNGELSGFNTDYIGFRQSLGPNLIPVPRKALILGTGGSSKAVAYALREMDFSFLFVSRKKQFQKIITYDDLDEEMIRDHRLIINTTPVGMFPDIHSFPDIPYQFLTKDHILFDLVYNPEKTAFLRQGENRGAFCMNGLQMLRFQAEASWDIWMKDLT